jgi:cytochrome c oxidase assembly factor CtaG
MFKKIMGYFGIFLFLHIAVVLVFNLPPLWGGVLTDQHLTGLIALHLFTLAYNVFVVVVEST